MNPKINTLISQFPILIFLSLHFLGNQTKSSINEKTKYERRNNRTNQSHWIQQKGSDHRTEEWGRNLRLKEWNPTEDDPRTIRSTLRSTLQTKNPHSDPWLLQSTQTHKERTKNREQRERIENKGRPSEHIGPMTIGPPLPNQNHLRISSIGREKREGREEREERIENGESCKNKKLFFFFYNLGYSELV